MAQRQVASSAKATCRVLEKFLSVLQHNVPALLTTAPGTAANADGYNTHMDTLTACKDLLNLYVDAFSADGTDVLGRHKKYERSFTVGDVKVGIAKTRTLTDQTLFWWYLLGPKNPGPWKEMHALARAWHLTSVQDPSSFRVYARERRKKLGWSN